LQLSSFLEVDIANLTTPPSAQPDAFTKPDVGSVAFYTAEVQ
jgi:hypothetical protein